MEIKGKKVLVVGMGVSGCSAASFLEKRGASVVGVDQRDLNVDYVETDFDFAVVSPGVAPDCSIYPKVIEVIGEIELACRFLTQPMIGITGTNGKTTVAMLVGHILNHSGRPAKVLGNVGVPLTSVTLTDEIVVCELSSFQLETMSSQVIDAAVILNITPDHLDRYASMEEYAAAKCKIADCLKPDGKLYVNEQAKKWINKEKIEWICQDRYRVKSSHDEENIMAAFVLCSEMGVTPGQFSEALETFEKPDHRIEFVKTVGGVNYYNDSKGTNLDAVIRAVDSMDGQVILIAGGKEKGVSFTPWIESFNGQVQEIIAIGEAKDRIQRELGESHVVKTCEDLETAVKLASSIAKQGENVLLSPGCASFDQFNHYAHRGEVFKSLVHALEF